MRARSTRSAAESADLAFLFSYGTLRQREVQLANYGRELDGRPDALTGYRLTDLTIGDPDVVALSGMTVHKIARPTGEPSDRVAGMLFELSEDELAATDRYETAAYSRVKTTLESGAVAWVYVGPAI